MDNVFLLTKEEVEYLVENLQHEYLKQETYYFASALISRMERFLTEQRENELARRDSKTA